jgi:hypothetical protein
MTILKKTSLIKTLHIITKLTLNTGGIIYNDNTYK